MGDEKKLERLQQWMQAIVTHPVGVAHGVASVEARATGLCSETDALETIVAPSRALSGAERLAIYSRSYHARLLQCFREMFPALLHALGQNLFDGFARDYLRRHPSRSYTLDHLADAFPQHLAETRPDENESWPDFIIELASLEWAFLKIYDGPGLEGRATPRARDILSSDDERVLQARPSPAPCLRLFAFRYPVHTYMLAARRGENPQLPAPSESFVAATRVNYRVSLHELNATQYALLAALDGQHTISQILDQDCLSTTTLRDWLCDWTSKGFFENIEISEDSFSR